MFGLCTSLAAQANVPLASFEHIPDSARLRKTIAGVWLSADIETLERLQPTEYTDGIGKRFSVERVIYDDVVEVRIIPYDTNFYSKKKAGKAVDAEAEATAEGENVRNAPSEEKSDAGFASDSVSDAENQKKEPDALPENLVPTDLNAQIPQGTWVLRRNKKTGEPLSITIYLRESSELFIVLHPAKLERIRDKSLIDFCLFGAYVRRDVPISFSFESLYYTSLVQLKERTKSILPWDSFDPPTTHSTVEATSKITAERLKQLVYIDDGAFDENGVPRYIETGKRQTEQDIRYACSINEIPVGQKIVGGVNCSGFVKWIVDGIIKPVAGSGTYIASLQKPTDVPNTGFTQSYEEKRDLFFGLDWIRNLAAARLSLTMQKTVYPSQTGIDVTVEPFSFSLPVHPREGMTSKFAGYFKSVGYQIEYLKPLLYYLAITEPENFYLVSVSRETGVPPLRQYNHVAAVFPYFDVLGCFHVDVYENAKATDLDKFIAINKGAFVSLVRIAAPEIGFYAP